MAPRVRFKTRLKQIQKLKDSQVRRADRATDRALNRFGAIIRQDSRKLIGPPARGAKFRWKIIDGKRQMVVTPPTKPRPPGSPPRARNTSEGANLRTIIYTVDKAKRSVRIGPMKLSGGKTYGGKPVPELHEFGATITVRVRKVQASITRENVKRRKGRDTQVSSRMILVESKNGTPSVVKMPRRPFMRPAYERHKSKATQIWKDYYKASRGRR